MTAAARTARVVRGVVAQAVRDAAAAGVVVLDDWTPEGELVYEWLTAELGEDQVWRAASLAGNVSRDIDVRDAQLLAAWSMTRERGVIVAHPANKTALLLGGHPPWADVYPLGDVWASQVEQLAHRWSGPPELEELAAAAGGLSSLDGALARLVDHRESAGVALADLPAAVAQRVSAQYERGRFFRLRPRLVPKLGTRTLGIDLFD